MNKKIDWTKTAHCQTRAHCKECLTGAYKGTTTEERYDIPEECPFGVTLDDLPEPKRTKRKDGRKDYTGCKSCKEKMLKKMKESS